MKLIKQGNSASGPHTTGASTLLVTVEDFPEVRFTSYGKQLCVFYCVGFSYRSLRFEIWEPADIDGLVAYLDPPEFVRESMPNGLPIEVTGYTKIREWRNVQGEATRGNVFNVLQWKEAAKNDHPDRALMPDIEPTH
jgi:hypothetical protein